MFNFGQKSGRQTWVLHYKNFTDSLFTEMEKIKEVLNHEQNFP